MLKYVLKRLLMVFPVMFGVSILAFLLVRAMPGDAATAYLLSAGVQPSKEAVASITKRLGLDRPLPVQYLDWMRDVLRFDFGESFHDQRPVGSKIWTAFQNTIGLSGFSLVITLIVSGFLGYFSALYPNSAADNFGRVFAFMGSSMPSFWLGVLLVQLFSLKLKWLPVSGMGSFRHYILPALSLAVLYIAMYSRVLRNSMLENMGKRFVLYSRARGLSEGRIIGGHVFRTSLVPVITTLGVTMGHMLGGTVIVEVVFSWPGIGRLIVDSITARDFPVIQGYIILMSMLFLTINLVTDII
ncbi:MAG: ABC transporter permease, partial [Treponema sp.]|nr:ABC transporter permease [Treponema sp.]